MNKEDLARHAALKSVLSKGKFEIHGEAILAVASLFKWYNELPSSVESKIQPVKAQEQVTKSKKVK